MQNQISINYGTKAWWVSEKSLRRGYMNHQYSNTNLFKGRVVALNETHAWVEYLDPPCNYTVLRRSRLHLSKE